MAGAGMFIWQIFYILLVGGIIFLVVRLLVIKNFPSKKKNSQSLWVGIPPYRINIIWQPNEARFVAEVPDLPSCTASGITREEALANAAAATRHWLKTAS